MNCVLLTGRVATMPEQKLSRDGQLPIAEFYVTYHVRKKEITEANHFLVVAFGGLADECKRLQLGDWVMIEGELRQPFAWKGEFNSRAAVTAVKCERVIPTEKDKADAQAAAKAEK